MSVKVGMALSGGGSRAVAHLGAIKALAENGIEISCYSGTSAGSMVAVLIADGVEPEVILEEVKSFSLFKVFSLSYKLSGFSNLKKINKILEKLLTHDKLEQLPIPVSVVATNLNSGKSEVFENGSVIDAVMASSSVPILFSPVKIGENSYIDGGVLMNLPAEPLKNKCDKIIGVSITPVVEETTREYRKALKIGFRTFELSILSNVRQSRELCDLFIEPAELSSYGIFSFGKMDKMFEIGYETTRKHMGEIEKLFELNKNEL